MKKEYYITWRDDKRNVVYKKKITGYPMRKLSKEYGIEIFYRKNELGFIITDEISGSVMSYGKTLISAKNYLSNLFYKGTKKEFAELVLRHRGYQKPLSELKEVK